MQRTLRAIATGSAASNGFTVERFGDRWSLASSGWHLGCLELAVARVEDGELECVSRMLLERIRPPLANRYVAGTRAPLGQDIILLRHIQSEPESRGGGQLLFGVLAGVADAASLWSALEAAPRRDLNRTLQIFDSAGFRRARPETDDRVFVRAPDAS